MFQLIDYAAIIRQRKNIHHLALIRKHHTNIFRFIITLNETVNPELLQNAVNKVHHRFPTIFAGFHHGFFKYTQVPAEKPPQVAEDPGLLINMTHEEIAQCACRVYYMENQVIIESFHALTDGYGMIAAFSTLIAEYLRCKYNLQISVGYPVFDLTENPKEEETEDSYLKYADSKPLHMPSRYSYQLPGMDPKCGPVHRETFVYPVEELLTCARKYGVSITALLSAVMASSIMELQHQRMEKKLCPVRIMVPIDLRKIFYSKTLRNFILYALPTMEVSEYGCSTKELALRFSQQIKDHLRKENLGGIIAYNVRTQNMPLFRMLPSKLKCGLMRVAYRFFGESNSSLTMSNLGNIALPEVMIPHVKSVILTMMPRVRSPYNCGMYSYNGNFYINLCRFPKDSQIEEIFQRNREKALKEEV
jgi:hypothetical protein